MPITVPILDLMIMDAHNAALLVVGDASQYPTGFNIISPTIEIAIPGYAPVSMPFVPSQMQVYNSASLGLNLAGDNCNNPLPDGLYRFNYSLYPAFTYNIERYYLRVEQLQEKFDRAFLKLDILQCDRDVKRADRQILCEVDDYIQGGISAANQNAQKLAIDCFNKASMMLDDFLLNRKY